MRAGGLPHLLQLQARANARTATGGFVPTWSTLTTVWGSVEPLTGRELFEQQKAHGELTHKVRIRFCAQASAEKRFLHNGRALEIVAVLNAKERNIELECLCKERAA